MLQRKPRKKRLSWKKMSTQDKVEILYLLLYTNLTRKDIVEKTGRSTAAVASTKREYTDTVITKVVTLKPKKSHMAALIKAKLEAEDETQG